MSPLDKKLWRDLWHMRGQALAIALVVASGVALLIMTRTTMEALDETRAAYFERYGFADVFATVKRAPRSKIDEIAAVPGVRAVEPRIVEFATIEVEGFGEPIVGELVSIPEGEEPRLNRLVYRAGRSVLPGRIGEVVVAEPFANAHHLTLGDRLSVLLNGHRRSLTIVGLALSPEFIYAIGPGQLMPDSSRFGVLWVDETTLEAAYDMENAFNNLVLALEPGTDSAAVIARLDTILAPFGGMGAFDRSDQLSNWYVSNEIEQHRNLSAILPSVFFAVAAFLLNMVLARLIATERGAIGLLKAFGYGNAAITWHYVKFVAVIAAIGVAIGGAVGYGIGRYHTGMYAELFSFPELIYRPRLSTLGLVVLIALGVAFIATLSAVLRAAALTPAEALRPPTPPAYRRTWLARSHVAVLFDQPTRIILRQIGRFPWRSAFSTFGIGMAISVLVIAFTWRDSVDRIVSVFFFDAQRQTATIGFTDITSNDALQGVRQLPGVLSAEPIRVVSARLRNGSINKRQAIEGVLESPTLSLVLDSAGVALSVPSEGLVLSTKLAEILHVSTGDKLWVEILEGRRPITQLPIVATFETYIGTPVYMRIDALNRLLEEPNSISAVHVLTDQALEGSFYQEVRESPRISAVTSKRAAVDTFKSTMAEVIDIFTGFFIVFSCTLTFGVIYNGVRIALSERGRDLATLRVLGFSRWQISYILLGELGVLTAFSLPIGCAAGYGLVRLIAPAFDTELYRVPILVVASTYGIAVVIALATAFVCGALVRRRLDRLDLIAVLKTRE